MRNSKQIALISAASAAVAVAALTGCSSWINDSGSRTTGREVDDNNITSEVKTKLSKEPVYKLTDVDVKTFDGVVQLNGFVRHPDQKQRAGELAQAVPGVARVVNNITLVPETPTPTGRTGATTSLQSAPNTTVPPAKQNQVNPPQ